MFRRISIVFSTVLLICSMSLNSLAAESSVPKFKMEYPSNVNALAELSKFNYLWYVQADTLSDDTHDIYSLTKDEEYEDISRDIDGLNYSFRSSVFHSNEPDGTSLDGLIFLCPGNRLLSHYRANYFDTIDLYIGINYYCKSAVTNFETLPQATLSALSPREKLLPSGQVVVSDMLNFDVQLVGSASRDYTGKSVTCVYRFSYKAIDHSEYFNDRFDVDSLFAFGFTDPIDNTDIIDINVGIIDGYISGGVQYDYNRFNITFPDIWGAVPNELPAVPTISLDGQSVNKILNSVSSLSLVSVIFVPVCVTGVSYFLLRIVIWKGV